MFEAYGDFAGVYDELMDNIPYKEWAALLSELINRYGVSRPVRKMQDPLESERNLVVDLGCGTGTLTELMYEKGYDMIGVDISEDMLNVAAAKRERSGYEILYLAQDIRELELYCTAGTIISVCDSLNYILDKEEMLNLFRLVNNYLYPEGIFLFDFNTVYKYECLIGDATIAENREDCSFIWENYYDPDLHLNEYDLTVFVKEADDRFRRFSETHVQRGYTPEEMSKLVEAAGLRIVEIMDMDTQGPVTGESGRVLIAAKESGKYPDFDGNEICIRKRG